MINDNLLDPNWIANILSISFTIVIFLLGIPIIIMQTFVPEELRKYYKILQKNHQRDLNISGFLLLMVVLFFGNYGFKYFLTSLPTHFSWSATNYTLDIQRLLFYYYFASLLFFLFLSFKIYAIFKKSIFREANVKVEILEIVFKSLKEKIENSKTDTTVFGELSREDRSTLIELSIIYSNGIDKVNFLSKIYEIIDLIISDARYDGKGIELLFDDVLSPIFIKSAPNCSYRQQREIIDICEKIFLTYKKRKIANFDCNYIANSFIFQYVITAIPSHNITLFRRCLIVLKRLESTQDLQLKIYKHIFEVKIYSLLVDEINQIAKTLILDSIDDVQRKAIKINFIAYLSLMFSGNHSMKQYVKGISIFLSNNNQPILLSDLEFTRNEFYKISDFEMVDKISNLI